MDEFLDPDIEVDVSRNVLNPGVYRGHAGFARMISAIDDVWDDFRDEIHELIDAGDQVVVQRKVLQRPASRLDRRSPQWLSAPWS